MGIFPGGKSTRINSPRHLTLRHSRRAAAVYQRKARQLAGIAVIESEEDVDPLAPGEQKLNSYWAPGLAVGPKHNITVKQHIEAPTGEKLDLNAEKSFFVDAPQFSLPEGSVHSTYPPPGYPDTNRILPHVVLTDPHLPWERSGSRSQGTNKELQMKMRALAEGASGETVRNRVPWLVMFSFSQDELRLQPQELDGSTSIFRNTSSGVTKPVKQSGTMTVNMSIDDLWKITDVTTPVTEKLGPESMKNSRGDFIFVKPDLFANLFPTSDSNNNPVKGSNPNALQYQYQAHVRKINGQGMALAGVEDTAVFSIVVGNRSGPLDNETPVTMSAHLVSIEGVEEMSWPGTNHRYVALCSLHSWNYTVLPANTLNVPDAFEDLGRTLNVLRAPEEIISPLRASSDKMKQLVAKRLDDGYTLVRYRTQTGESTVALYRGPFTPSFVPPLENLTTSSNSGVDLQVLDKQLGIMDITYSVAWQVGRTMALGDEAYTAALNRLRTSIHSTAEAASKLQTVKNIDDTAFRTRSDVLGGIDSAIRSLASIHLSGNDDINPGKPIRAPRYVPGGAKRRWKRSRLARSELPDMSFGSPLIRKYFPNEAVKAAQYLARSTSGGTYDETNDPVSTDWMIVLAWLLDRMFLAGVPAHCLIPDPTYLEPERLRFFRIDNNWVDALIDGALSLGNHYGDDEDRTAIKEALNDYIKHIPEGQEQPVQIPAYGFYLRSDLVTMFPDLRVEVLDANGATASSGAPLLRHEIVTDGVMMAFMDRIPGSDQFASLVFTQPAHQQRFAVARGVDPAEVKVDIRRQYTVEQSIREKDDKRHDALKPSLTYNRGSADNIFLWDAKSGSNLNDLRVIWPPQFADTQLKKLQDGMGTYNEGGTQKRYFDDNAPTSALFAMQLNDPIYNLTIDLQSHKNSEAISQVGPPGGSSSPEIRTLRLMGTARVKKLTPDGRSGTTPSKKQDDDDDYGATFKRLQSYVATPTALSSFLAPHVRALPVTSAASLPEPDILSQIRQNSNVESKAVSSSQPIVRDIAGSPRFQITVSSNIIGHWEEVQLDDDNLAQDLIFSVIVNQDEVSQYQLVEVDIQIDVGESSSFLMNTYTGPGAHMLTNMRFNVLPTVIQDKEKGINQLRLRLLPRSAKGWVYATQVSELTFLLGLAKINAPAKLNSEFKVQTWARYMRSPNQGLGPDNILTITNPDTIVKVVNLRYGHSS
ncbi:hypothetical protein F5Y00DRAFT_273079 [Daldinia vernicosa]|uniref:uncharacterized protein n=1 Tax=Daldinia vernicosa TaxID=114800 RepID=UPI002007A0F8|nr:uncharacterized protein F5Y00DRAFT_273079 [Daldinia vernicosa]KAI0852453.1 hypothetical protein F5Y00DRAFT_273079 [Daldinia vernicosa]